MRSWRRQRVGRHLDGWQAGLLSVFLAGVVAALVVPRAVPPREIPLPIVAPRDVDAVVARDRAASRAARENRAPAIARVGDAFREVGIAEAAGDPALVKAMLARLRDAREDAAPLGDAPLVELRGYQTESFLASVEAYQTSGEHDALVALGGSILATLRENGWIDETSRSVLADPFELRAIFHARYAALLDLDGPSFAIAPVERRAILRLCIRLPALPKGGERGDPSTRTYSDAWLLERLSESENQVPDYPFALARGILHYRNQRFADARRELGAATSDRNGPYALRAFNHLRAAFVAEAESVSAP